MLAVVELWGNQFIVKVWDIIEVKKQEAEEKSKISVEAFLISDEDGKNVKIWTPTVKNSKVEFKVLKQSKWDKIRVFKMKSKKRYVRNKGFRSSITKLEVLSIG
jgi:large subunit ribosomal protein L21